MEKNQKSKKDTLIDYLIFRALKYGILIGGTVLFIEFVPVGAIFGMLISRCGYTFSSMLGLATIEVAEQATPKVVLEAAQTTSNFMGDFLSDKLTKPVRFAIDGSIQSMKNLIGFVSETIDANDYVQNRKWAACRLAMDDSIVSPEEKAMLIKTYKDIKPFSFTNKVHHTIFKSLDLVNTNSMRDDEEDHLLSEWCDVKPRQG